MPGILTDQERTLFNQIRMFKAFGFGDITDAEIQTIAFGFPQAAKGAVKRTQPKLSDISTPGGVSANREPIISVDSESGGLL